MVDRKRKRTYEDDDESFQDYRPRVPKRQRIPPVVQLCKEMMPDICTIGESPKAFADDIKFLSEAIVSEYGHEDYFNNAFLSTLRAVTLEQPHKQPAIALLILAINAGSQIAGKSILNFFFDELQKCCDASAEDTGPCESNDTGPWNKVKLYLRMLSLLSPMIINDDIIGIYQKLLDFAVELNNIDESKRNALSEAIFTNTILNIPYLFYFKKGDDEALKNHVEELITTVEGAYKMKISNIKLLSEYDSNSPYNITELIQVALPNVKKVLANNMDQLFQLFCDWKDLLPEQPDNHGFNDALRLPEIEQLSNYNSLLNGVGSVDNMWKGPRYCFHVYLPHSSGEFDTVLPISSYAGQLFNDVVIDVVQSLEFNRKEVCKQLNVLPLFFKEGIFANMGDSIAQIAAIYEDNPLASTFKLEDLEIEAILSLIFKLPDVSQPFAYFYTLLVDICQNNPKAIAPVFGRAFRFFYNNIESLDFELRQRFLDWFSVQMSNFNFSWKWNEWEKDSNKFRDSFYNPKIIFMKNLVRKELRLTSNVSEVDDSLPQEFKRFMETSYLPVEEVQEFYQSLFTNYQVRLEDAKKNDLLFTQSDIPFEPIVRELADYVHKQNDVREISELEAIIEKLREHSSEITDFNRFIVVLLTQVVIHCGSRSLSHANKYITDLKSELTTIFDKLEIETETKEQAIIDAVLAYWNVNSQTGYLIVDALKFSELISAKSVLNYCLSEKNGKVFALTDITAIDTIFRTLSQQLITNAGDNEAFEFVFEKLCLALNSSIETIGVSQTENIVLPDLSEQSEIDPINELPKLEVAWKYFAILGFVKSILRKYSSQYLPLVEKFTTGMTNVISHEPTQKQLLEWINEVPQI
ncbi:similar to Saccharomyces cerevisiae YMR125W STO1 Large subunit of the nuclear mRNA cap-binding protein complex, interacts with Npl3p to carry nuclear poly(A)+ mRNA to cytoplasm [Maudiozyma barnettii]|uniref:Nuclear cap-binding protein complex subunit 1 n=1 Tax=Maudiozyma barnettii TaxID=61262 RepID=A0A8H2VFA6_9SACH|nr:Sto1p [Kazachstania barnettii]CAB4254460.1 similar to Saccharomyces cerevisiae YMR125W STO1 Large subunit of the nuclear mRNA cap-binding protein complex, interacts with Npl3p to carry nuclear poly(A)+ mRNA to cytoplasm [Kazachstania barnettii]CAD1782431.1 similar to Saccharomyces cerevisiae YMR125W STO1 Large subunit of the nuclear mRNA cap-binding protein complex, interacts with Npl3p to carry nuclear poly(A)+ mRNA to cytoplasm [Kazachstania barnettii]